MTKDDVLAQVSDALKDLQSCSDLTMRDGDFARTEASRLLALIAALAHRAVAPHCATCNDNGLIGGPSFADPGEGGVPCPDCTISREQWIEQAMRVYLIAGDTEQVARECATYLWGEVDKDDLPDATDAAMEDVEGRGPTPQAGAESYPAEPTPDELRAIAREARNSSGSASDDCGPAAYVLHGWRAATAALRARGAMPEMPKRVATLERMKEWEAKGELAERMWGACMDLERENAALRAQLSAPQPPAALPGEQDAARYRWLRSNAVGAFRTNDGKGPVSVYHLAKIPAIPGIPEETDAAIDAAVAAAKGRTDGGAA